uniref:DNA 5'-3' helicase n=1 Tax=Lepeophtheirus salmonis TaxID=72036 RepID=A0A0K2UK35_LEPSM
MTSSQILTTMAFLQDSQIFNIDLFKILQYILKSKLSYKLRGFSQKYSNEAQKPSNTQTFLNSMKKNYKEESPAQGVRPETESDHSDGPSQINILFSFISNLVEDLDDGRVVITHSNDFSGSSIKFILLNPTNHFKDLVKECHSIIVAGGTMEPVDEFKKRLFISSGATTERIHHFSCGHIIPESNILPIVLHRGPSGKLLDFSFSLRDLKETYEEILRILSNLVTIIPGGIVVFFPSYHYETKVHAFLSKSSTWNNLVAKKKKLYREPKNSDAVEEVLKAYSNSVQNSDGAILFSVVGGKMSEGINFSDDMGRCVLMIGLPFSNSKSPELKEKMEYLNRTEGSNAGNSYYENSCMKAVNQSIGRAIRHGNDYATIILADHRYSRGNIHELLPGWIRDKVWNSDKFGPVVPRIRQFFKSKSV